MRVCPLFFASTADLEDFVCRPDRCALAYDGTCSITSIAHSLESLQNKLRDDA